MPEHSKWTYRSRTLVIWNITRRWNNWNYGEIHPRSGSWISFGRIAGRDAARRAAQNFIDVEMRGESNPPLRRVGHTAAMSAVKHLEGRSMAKITKDDLATLAKLAADDRDLFFSKKPKCIALASHVLGTALCQGAALHYVDGKNGVKDFDVWTFYAVGSGQTFPPRRIVSRDFGSPKFGRSPDRPLYDGRRVDLLGRSIPAQQHEDPVSAIRRYLRAGKTESARRLREKAVVILEPKALRGTIVWPVLR